MIEKMQARLKIMEGEMYQRSNEQVKKEIRLERMNHEIEGKKKEISAITEQQSRGTKHELREVQKRLVERDDQISVLKDMLKSAQQQTKTKEGEIARLKSRVQKFELGLASLAPRNAPALLGGFHKKKKSAFNVSEMKSQIESPSLPSIKGATSTL